MLECILFIEILFSITIDNTDITNENFQTIDTVVGFILQKEQCVGSFLFGFPTNNYFR